MRVKADRRLGISCLLVRFIGFRYGNPAELVVTKFGKVVMHKAKRNNNLSFSKGKTWQLEDVRALEVIGVGCNILMRGAVADSLAGRFRSDNDDKTISLANGQG